MRLTLAVLSTLTLVASLEAQTPFTAGNTAAVPAAGSDAYAYHPDGRRDPFLSVLTGGTDVRPIRKEDGPAGFSLAEISVRGVVQSRSTLIAMIQGPDNKTYLIHQGDKLADAVVKSVTTQGLVVMQDVSDPLSVQKQREVRKLLRSLEGAQE